MCRCATFDILPVSHFEPPDYGGSTEFFHYMCNLKHRYISLCHVADAMSPTTRLPSALITAAVRLTTERLEPAMHRDVDHGGNGKQTFAGQGAACAASPSWAVAVGIIDSTA